MEGYINQIHINHDKIYHSLGELKKDVACILLGTVMQQRITYSGPGGSEGNVPWTHSVVIVEHVLKGALTPGKQIEVEQLGGRGRDGMLAMAYEFPLLIIGTRYILFLNPHQDEFVMMGPQGVYIVDDYGEVNSMVPLDQAIEMHLPFQVRRVPLERFVADVKIAPEQ